ncbi:MAG: C39 family peptidase [Deltaproteobacteria bacterium]|nr:C39 family peptidase [Deltaproteobacteria bacterium]MBN2671372.1 C39 family peptidase [Deltaproteobacteria bacterium]
MKKKLHLEMLPQPNSTTCGPTCLHAVYRFLGDSISLQTVIDEVPSLEGGGTLGVMLANHALTRGYNATIYTYNLMVFDPTWFHPGVDIRANLYARQKASVSAKQKRAIKAYLHFIDAGGKIAFEDPGRELLRRFLKSERPVLTGLNSTFLYRAKRVNQKTLEDDDINGEVDGHFVVLSGYDREHRTIHILDPYEGNPYAEQSYDVPIDRVIGAILLGVMTYDANFLIIEPVDRRKSSSQ